MTIMPCVSDSPWLSDKGEVPVMTMADYQLSEKRGKHYDIVSTQKWHDNGILYVQLSLWCGIDNCTPCKYLTSLCLINCTQCGVVITNIFALLLSGPDLLILYCIISLCGQLTWVTIKNQGS